jgi:hypothetical protein
LLAVGHCGQHLDLSATILGRTQAHEVELAGVADPCGSVQRPVNVFAPPQPDIALAGINAAIIGGVEAGQRAITLELLGACGCDCSSHRHHRFREGARAEPRAPI